MSKLLDYIKMRGYTEKSITVRVGFIGTATYPDSDQTVAEVAHANEYGGPNRPPRPFFRGMIAKESPQWGKQIAALLNSPGATERSAMGLMGQLVADQLRQSIEDLTDPPLAPSTILAKGFDKPLVDTGLMQQSITYEVDA